jgi:hypothetical protein
MRRFGLRAIPAFAGLTYTCDATRAGPCAYLNSTSADWCNGIRTITNRSGALRMENSPDVIVTAVTSDPGSATRNVVRF